MAKYSDWTDVAWQYNSAIKLPCIAKSMCRTIVFLHQAYKCIDTEANGGNGEWVLGDGFDFTVKGQFSGRCPDTVKTLEEAKIYVEKYVPTKV